MSDKYLHIKFRGGGLFPKNTNTKDFTYHVTKGREKRSLRKNGNFKEPITVHQISNLLHVLMGERPVPSFRYAGYKKIDEIFEMAMNSYLKIDSPKQEINRKGVITEEFTQEIKRLGKSAVDSWSKPSHIEWFKIKKYLTPELFDVFIDLMTKALGYNPLYKPFMDLVNIQSKIGSDRLSDVFEFIKLNRKTPLYNFFTKEKPNIYEFTANTRLGGVVNSGIDKVIILDGEIYVPITDKQIDKLVMNVATILDGGLASIVGVVYEHDISNVQDFISVGEISDEKY
jgi:hypothetical protein